MTTLETIVAMRYWLATSHWPDHDSYEITTLSDREIISAVEANYEDGRRGFLRTH